MKINELEDKIINKLEGDKLAIFLDKKQDQRRNLDLISNRLSLYYAGFCFLFGWIFFLIFQAFGNGALSSTQISSGVATQLTSSSYLKFSILFAVFSCWGMIVDTIKLYVNSKRYEKELIKLNKNIRRKK